MVTNNETLTKIAQYTNLVFFAISLSHTLFSNFSLILSLSISLDLPRNGFVYAFAFFFISRSPTPNPDLDPDPDSIWSTFSQGKGKKKIIIRRSLAHVTHLDAPTHWRKRKKKKTKEIYRCTNIELSCRTHTKNASHTRELPRLRSRQSVRLTYK